MYRSEPQRTVPSAAVGAALLLLIFAGPVLAAGAPRPARAAQPMSPDVEIRDHRGKERLRFLVFGDSGTGEKEQYDVGRRMAEACASRGGCDFALVAGDLVYPSGVDPTRHEEGKTLFDPRFKKRFEAPFEPLGRLDVWAVPGNHDWRRKGSVDAEIEYARVSPRLRMPWNHYEVPRLPDWIRIYGIDTTAMMRHRERSRIEDARAALCDGGGWKLLLGHHPVYASGRHAKSGGQLPKVRRLLLKPLIEPCGVHLYIAGHDHQQEHLSANGFEQIVQGAAANPLEMREVKKRPAGVRQLIGVSRLGFAIIDATPERLEIRFFGLDDATADGSFYCRVVELETFDDPERRSHPCEPPIPAVR